MYRNGGDGNDQPRHAVLLKDEKLVFAGTHHHTIDPKGRLSIPAEIRSLVRDRLTGGDATEDAAKPVYWWVTLGEGCTICLYTEAEFEKRAVELDRSEMDPRKLLEFERLMYSLSSRVEMDKAGRVRLPEMLLQMAGVGTEVTLLGVKDHLEVHDRGKWESHVKAMLAQPGMLMNPRLAMRNLDGTEAGPGRS